MNLPIWNRDLCAVYFRINLNIHLRLLLARQQCANTLFWEMNESRINLAWFSVSLRYLLLREKRANLSLSSRVSSSLNVIVSVIDVGNVSIFTCEQLQLFVACACAEKRTNRFLFPCSVQYSRSISWRLPLIYFYNLREFAARIFSSVFSPPKECCASPTW